MPGCCDETMALRDEINGWLKRSAAAGDIDGVIDFGSAVEDPEKPGYMVPAYDSGDHLHPSPRGGEQMAAAGLKQLENLLSET